jgi:hypothetical protein
VGGYHAGLHSSVHRTPLHTLCTDNIWCLPYSADVGGYHAGLHSSVHRQALHLSRTHPSGLAAMSHEDEEDEVQQGLMMMPEIDELEQQPHEALSNDEAHDQLMELPYGGACCQIRS